MFKSKRFNGSMAAVVVLAVILTIAVTAGATVAWFTSLDRANNNFALGGAVVVKVADEEGVLGDAENLDIQIPAGKLVPGMTLYPTIYADVLQTTTPSLLRAKVDIKVTVPDTYATDHGIDEPTVQAQVAAIESHLLDMFKFKANGWYYHGADVKGEDDEVISTADDWFYFVGNNQAYSYYMTDVADTSELNAVVESLYAPAGTGGDYTDQTTDTDLLPGNQVASILFYELNEDDEQNLDSPIEAEAENGIITVDNKTYAHVPFMVRPFILPITWGNEVAELTIDITVTFEAVQDYLVDPTATDKDSVPQRLTTIDWVQKVFNSASDYEDPYEA